MTTIIIALLIFLDILYYLIIFDVILSWLALAGVRFRPQFLVQIINPIYETIRAYIPTRIGVFEITPIITLLLILFLQGVIMMNFPEVTNSINNLRN